VTWNCRQPAVKALDLVESFYLEPWGRESLGRVGPMLVKGVEDLNEDGWSADWLLLVPLDGGDLLLAMRGSSITHTMPMIGNKEVVDEEEVRKVLLKLGQDPHVGTDSKVMRPSISPDVDGVNVGEEVTLHEVLPHT